MWDNFSKLFQRTFVQTPCQDICSLILSSFKYFKPPVILIYLYQYLFQLKRCSNPPPHYSIQEDTKCATHDLLDCQCDSDSGDGCQGQRLSTAAVADSKPRSCQLQQTARGSKKQVRIVYLACRIWIKWCRLGLCGTKFKLCRMYLYVSELLVTVNLFLITALIMICCTFRLLFYLLSF